MVGYRPVRSDARWGVQTGQTETAFWKFFTSQDTYDPDRLNYDRELLRRFYLGNGYADFRVVSAVAELTPDRKDFFVTFTIEEGERYKFADIQLTSGTTSCGRVDGTRSSK